MAEDFDVCWSTVIAASDTHAAFDEAPDNGWVQRCRLESGHAGIHATDGGIGPRVALRPWLQWDDDEGAQRFGELESCPASDGVDLACFFFAGHGGGHHYVPTSSTPRFGSHYRPDTRVPVNGSRRAGSIATAESLTVTTADREVRESAPASSAHQAPEVEAPVRRSRHSGEPVEVKTPVADHVGPVRPVDEVLLDLVDLLSELAAAVKAQREG